MISKLCAGKFRDFAAAAAFLTSQQAMTTCQPCLISAWVACRPTPEDAPVTKQSGLFCRLICLRVSTVGAFQLSVNQTGQSHTTGDQDMERTWIRPVLILGALAALITLNIIEFRGKRKQDALDMAAVARSDNPDTMLAHRQYRQTQNIEQVLHIVNSVLIALLFAVLTA
ncbi:MAG: hypothetical protein ACKVKF_12870 [Rhodobacterales bacterium]|nr:hypothetical protein [Puniceibacterium antarcticum]